MSVRFDPSSSSATSPPTVTPSTTTPPSETEKTQATAQKNLCPGPGCSNPATKLCGRCRAISYCDATCQRADWPTHKKTCIPIDPSKKAAPEKKETPVDVLWKSIEATAKFWLGGGIIKTPQFGTFENSCAFWSHMNELHEDVLNETFAKAAMGHKGNGVALDLGCGRGEFSLFLAYTKEQSEIIAVDRAKNALDFLEEQVNRRNSSLLKEGKLKTVHQDITEFNFNRKFALIAANDVLPYVDPSKLRSLWNKIFDSLEPNGLFMGSLFYRSQNRHLLIVRKENLMREIGANFIDAPHMARNLLTLTGYKIEILQTRSEAEATIDFVARKQF